RSADLLLLRRVGAPGSGDCDRHGGPDHSRDFHGRTRGAGIVGGGAGRRVGRARRVGGRGAAGGEGEKDHRKGLPHGVPQRKAVASAMRKERTASLYDCAAARRLEKESSTSSAVPLPPR